MTGTCPSNIYMNLGYRSNALHNNRNTQLRVPRSENNVSFNHLTSKKHKKRNLLNQEEIVDWKLKEKRRLPAFLMEEKMSENDFSFYSL